MILIETAAYRMKIAKPYPYKKREPHTPYTYIVAQPDGLLLYHINPAMVENETMDDAFFSDFPEVVNLVDQYSVNRTGYTTFSYYATGSTQIVPKETFWDTVMLHGTEWRVLVIREI